MYTKRIALAKVCALRVLLFKLFFLQNNLCTLFLSFILCVISMCTLTRSIRLLKYFDPQLILDSLTAVTGNSSCIYTLFIDRSSIISRLLLSFQFLPVQKLDLYYHSVLDKSLHSTFWVSVTDSLYISRGRRVPVSISVNVSLYLPSFCHFCTHCKFLI